MDRLAEVPPIMASICMDSEGLDGVRASRLFRFAIIHFFLSAANTQMDTFCNRDAGIMRLLTVAKVLG